MTKNRKQAGCGAALASSLTEDAAHLSAQGKYAAAEKRLLLAARSLRQTETASRLERAVVWNELGMVCKYLGKFRSSERYYRQALNSIRYLAGQKRDALLADLYHNLGGLEHSRGRFSNAEKYARKGLRLRLQFSSDDNPAVASDLAALAAILDGLEKYDESEPLYHEALRIYRSQFAAVHPEIAVVLNNLGALHQAAGRQRRAEHYYRAALRMKRRVLSESHPDIGLTMNNLATVLYTQGRLSSASRWFQEALLLSNESLGKLHPHSRSIQRNFNRYLQLLPRRKDH